MPKFGTGPDFSKQPKMRDKNRADMRGQGISIIRMKLKLTIFLLRPCKIQLIIEYNRPNKEENGVRRLQDSRDGIWRLGLSKATQTRTSNPATNLQAVISAEHLCSSVDWIEDSNQLISDFHISMRRSSFQPLVHTLVSSPVVAHEVEDDDLESSMRSSASTRRANERMLEPPVECFEALNTSPKKIHSIKHSNSSSFLRAVAVVVCAVVLCVLSFSMGHVRGGASKIHKTVLDDALAEAREEVLQDQENLVLELTKLRREVSQNREENVKLDDAKKGSADAVKTGDELEALYHHVELLKKNLNLTSHKLNEEKKLREEAEANVKQVWGAYELHTSQLQAEQNKQAEGLASLFENLLSEEFGMGPHYVQFQLDIPEENGSGTFSSLPHQDSFFTVELFHTMPTSSFFFLKQVQAGIWDGRFFHFNDPHFLLTDLTMASDSINTASSSFARQIFSSQRDSLDQLLSAGLAHLPYAENLEPHHDAYTLGYRGVDSWKDRPGPAFFINKVNNREFHKGQPCFGKILLGRQVVDRMGELVGPAQSLSFIQPIQIVSAQILGELREAVGGEEYLRELQTKNRKEEI